jgi:hypothetical protein
MDGDVTLLDRADYENAEEQLMRPEVMKQPLLPLYEAIHNAIHASQENESNNILINIDIIRDDTNFIDSVARINGFTITDYGVGFTDEKTLAFLKLFTTDKKKKFNSKGIGRLSFFSAFINVDINSTYKYEDNFCERNFSVTIDNIGKIKIPDATLSKNNGNITSIKIYNIKQELDDKYYISIEYIVEQLKEHFAAAILSSEFLEINIHDKIQYKINKESYSSDKGDNFIIADTQFEVFYIKNKRPMKSKHKIFLTAAGRAVVDKDIDFLANTKIGGRDDDKFYLSTIVTSYLFDDSVDSTRTRFINIPETSDLQGRISLEQIYLEIYKNVRLYVEKLNPEITNANNETISKVIEELPHLSIVSSEQSVIDKIPLYSSRKQIRDVLIQEYAKKQLEALNFVRIKSKQYEKKGVPNFEEFIKNEQYKLEQGMKLNHAHLTTYILYREYIISLFSQFLRKNNNQKYSPEYVLHNLIFPMKTESDNCENDYYNHNLWLIDDRYATYKYLSSDISEYVISESGYDKNDKRYDIFAIYEEPQNGAANNVFLVELKQTHKQLSHSNDPIQQLINYAIRIRNGKLDKHDGSRINISDNTQYYGIALCDIHNQYFKDEMIARHSLKKRSDGKSYFTLQINETFFIEVTNYENLLEIARIRNKAFMDKLKGQ